MLIATEKMMDEATDFILGKKEKIKREQLSEQMKRNEMKRNFAILTLNVIKI